MSIPKARSCEYKNQKHSMAKIVGSGEGAGVGGFGGGGGGEDHDAEIVKRNMAL